MTSNSKAHLRDQISASFYSHEQTCWPCQFIRFCTSNQNPTCLLQSETMFLSFHGVLRLISREPREFIGMNHTISITKLMTLNNFSNKTKKILNKLCQNFCNHNYKLAHTAAQPRCWMMKNKRWQTSPAPMIVNPLTKHENEEFSFLFFSVH